MFHDNMEFGKQWCDIFIKQENCSFVSIFTLLRRLMMIKLAITAAKGKNLD